MRNHTEKGTCSFNNLVEEAEKVKGAKRCMQSIRNMYKDKWRLTKNKHDQVKDKQCICQKVKHTVHEEGNKVVVTSVVQVTDKKQQQVHIADGLQVVINIY